MKTTLFPECGKWGPSIHLESAGAAATQLGNCITTQTSNLTSADLATTLTKLDQTQTAYQAALESAAKIMNLSILNYIQ